MELPSRPTWTYSHGCMEAVELIRFLFCNRTFPGEIYKASIRSLTTLTELSIVTLPITVKWLPIFND